MKLLHSSKKQNVFWDVVLKNRSNNEEKVKSYFGTEVVYQNTSFSLIKESNYDQTKGTNTYS